jgi:hypothetical protein
MASAAAIDADRFEGWLKTELSRAIASGITSYTTLLHEIGDVYPSVMLTALWRLAAVGDLDPQVVAEIGSSARRPCHADPERTSSNSLVVPHPLDFDWRFSERALRRLEEETRLADPSRLICLGAPSLFWYAREKTPRTVQLLDANAGSLRTDSVSTAPMEQVQLDLLRDELPSIRAGAIVADPPWYSEHLRAFTWAARDLCDVGGRIWISVPGVGTRPGVEGEHVDLVTWATGLGLRLVQRLRGALPYLTPPFERNALRAEGIECIPAQWRRGDLLVFKVVGANVRTRPFACALEIAEWEEVRLQQIRLRFRVRKIPEADGPVDPRPHSLVPGDVLPSVSRRDSRRAGAQIWTSGNRVFGCKDPRVACEIARGISQGADVIQGVETYLRRRMSTVEKSCIHKADAHLRKLVEFETVEYGDQWGRA